MHDAVQSALPFAPWAEPQARRLPGTMPLARLDDWLVVDDAYAAQMALRDHLIRAMPDRVHGVTPVAGAACVELYDLILQHLPALGFRLDAAHALRPDGVTVPLDRAAPLLTLGRLIQEDLCLMQEDGQGEHCLTAAILCFPAGWTLSEKLGQPMMRIHAPVKKYTEDVGRRVQRLMDLVRVGAPLWRANAHQSRAPLFNPLPESAPKDTATEEMAFIRSERQTFVRLPVSRAVVFSIHTYLVRIENLTEAQRSALTEFPIHSSD